MNNKETLKIFNDLFIMGQAVSYTNKEGTKHVELNKYREMEMELNVKGLRIRIDAYASLMRDHLNQTRQVNNSVDDLMLAKAWLGKALGSIGTDSPYRNDGKREGIQDIEPAADTSNMLIMNDLYNESGFEVKNPTERVDFLREAIKDTIKSAVLTLNYGNYDTVIGSHTIDNVMMHLSEARFWLGFELERQKVDYNTPIQG